MNKKHFLIVLVMVAVASASLFVGFQAYRYNRSMMNKSVFSNNIEVQAGPLEAIGNWFLKMDERRHALNFNLTTGPCDLTVTSTNGFGQTVTTEYHYPESHFHVCEEVNDGSGTLHNCYSQACHVDGIAYSGNFYMW